MYTKIAGIVVIVAAISIFAFFYTKNLPTDTDTTPTTQNETATSTSYTLSEIAAHSAETSCWSAINGKVYDLTEWIKKHPGGSKAILGICGTDGSAAFNGKHGGQDRPENTLTGFFIGELKVE